MSRFGYQRLRIGVVLGAALAVGGIGVAGALAGPNDTVQSCVRDDQGQGNARIVNASTTCLANEHRVAWNKSGPTGPTGATGSSGATGATGAAGPSDAYVDDQGVISLGPTTLTVASLTLPAGDYVLMANSLLTGPGSVAYSCNVKLNGSTVSGRIVYTSAAEPHGTLSIMFTATVGVGGAMYNLECTASVAASSAFETHFVATRVGTLHTQ